MSADEYILSVLSSFLKYMQSQSSVSLVPFSSFHSIGSASNFFEITTEEDIVSLFEQWVFQNKFYILWNGCNTLFDGDFEGNLVKNSLSWIEKLAEDEMRVTLQVGAGEDWVAFVKYCVAHNYAGIENLSEIPGTVGAAPVQNIGAYGAEVADVIKEVHGIDLQTGEKKIFSQQECSFWYRESIFKSDLKGLFIITAVVFTLQKYWSGYQLNLDYADIQNYIYEYKCEKDQLWIKELSEIITIIRREKLPNLDERWTAGSFFKNPIIPKSQYEILLESYPMLKSYPVANLFKTEEQVKIPAAQLIELVGLKGVLEDGVGTYINHALIIVSKGEQDGAKIVKFSQKIQREVNQKFGILLKLEVNIV